MHRELVDLAICWGSGPSGRGRAEAVYLRVIISCKRIFGPLFKPLYYTINPCFPLTIKGVDNAARGLYTECAGPVRAPWEKGFRYD